MTNQIQKNILVLSDNDFLFDVLKVNLEIDQFAPRLFTQDVARQTTKDDNPDLIIIASSSSTTEPVVALADAALTELIGQIPLLIISDRSFPANLDRLIFHLDFPFEAETLRHKVRTILAHNRYL